MVWVIGILVVVVIGLAVFAGVGRLGEMPDQLDDRPGPDLPDEQLTGADVRNVKFAVTTRGYSMEQVDAVLERLAAQIDAGAAQGLGDGNTAGTSLNPSARAWLDAMLDNGGVRPRQQ